MDIDGVLNPFYARQNPELQEQGFTFLQKGKEGFFLNPQMHIKWFNKIGEHVTFIWGSNWGEESNLVLELLSIDQTWLHIPLVFEETYTGTWKLPSIREWVNTHTTTEDKIVWVDDELQADAFLWGNQNPQYLLIQPQKEVGLTEKDFEKIFKFII